MKNACLHIHGTVDISVSEKIEMVQSKLGKWTTQNITIKTEDGDTFIVTCFSPIKKENNHANQSE